MTGIICREVFCRYRLERASSTRLKVAVCACFPPKVHDGTQTLRCRICSMAYRNNKLRG